MSRIGKQPVNVPKDVKVSVVKNTLNVEGPKGKLSQMFSPELTMTYNKSTDQILVTTSSSDKTHKALHGLTRSLIANMITGVTSGYSKNLEIVGLGYTAKVQGKDFVLSLGYTHPIQLKIPEGIKVEIKNPTNPVKLTVSGADKQTVGQFSAVIREMKPPEPYKGMGVKYEGEVIRRKAGKAFASGG
ncbi:MAG: 50S ribosomal protein L6 [Candidatus Loosdrechtia sp.]|uniref:50S ribosomal protein L6 n=1 Tax=Candidatus Loosdrechtia sp. TaxID=3101272 RepID=UPI003A5E2B56|nr:MAG: 50S ribosomal protein L6 [Candidatus Jettenia sp. AMX2]